MKTLHVNNRKFSIEELENVLSNCIPGYYIIVWHTKKDIYDIMLHWNGKEFRDLHRQELYV